MVLRLTEQTGSRPRAAQGQTQGAAPGHLISGGSAPILPLTRGNLQDSTVVPFGSALPATQSGGCGRGQDQVVVFPQAFAWIKVTAAGSVFCFGSAFGHSRATFGSKQGGVGGARFSWCPGGLVGVGAHVCVGGGQSAVSSCGIQCVHVCWWALVSVCICMCVSV